MQQSVQAQTARLRALQETAAKAPSQQEMDKFVATLLEKVARLQDVLASRQELNSLSSRLTNSADKLSQHEKQLKSFETAAAGLKSQLRGINRSLKHFEGIRQQSSQIKALQEQTDKLRKDIDRESASAETKYAKASDVSRFSDRFSKQTEKAKGELNKIIDSAADSVTKSVANSKAEIDRTSQNLMSRFGDVEKEFSSTSQKISDYQSQVKQLNRRITSIDGREARLEALGKELKSAQDYQSQLEALKKEIDESESISSLNRKFVAKEEFSSSEKQLRDEVKALGQLIKDNERSIRHEFGDRLRQELSSLDAIQKELPDSAYIKEMENDLDAMAKHLGELDKLRNIDSDVKALSQQVKALSELKSLNADILDLRKKLDDLNKVVSESETISGLEKRFASRDELKGLSDQLKEQEQSVKQALKETQSSLKGELKNFGSQLAAEDRVMELELDFEELRKQVSKIESQAVDVADINKEITSAVKDVPRPVDYSKQLEKLSAEMQDMKKLIARKPEVSAASLEKVDREISKLKETLKQAQYVEDADFASRKELDVLKKSVSKVPELSRVEKRIDGLESELASVSRQLPDLSDISPKIKDLAEEVSGGRIAEAESNIRREVKELKKEFEKQIKAAQREAKVSALPDVSAQLRPLEEEVKELKKELEKQIKAAQREAKVSALPDDQKKLVRELQKDIDYLKANVVSPPDVSAQLRPLEEEIKELKKSIKVQMRVIEARARGPVKEVREARPKAGMLSRIADFFTEKEDEREIELEKPKAPKDVPKPSQKKGFNWLWLLLALIIVGAVVAGYFLLKPSGQPQQIVPINESQPEQEAGELVPVNETPEAVIEVQNATENVSEPVRPTLEELTVKSNECIIQFECRQRESDNQTFFGCTYDEDTADCRCFTSPDPSACDAERLAVLMPKEEEKEQAKPFVSTGLVMAVIVVLVLLALAVWRFRPPKEPAAKKPSEEPEEDEEYIDIKEFLESKIKP